MGFQIDCPNCGRRDYHEFWYGHEYHSVPKRPEQETVEANFERVWMRANAAGPQLERWFHFAGCRRWLTVERDTRSNATRTTSGQP